VYLCSANQQPKCEFGYKKRHHAIYASRIRVFCMVFILKMELIITKRNGEQFTVLYDECDHEFVSSHSWSMSFDGYARAAIKNENGKWVTRSMHRLLLNPQNRSMEVDHINHNRVDNRRCNLRLCTKSENQKNITPRGRSKYLGVSYDSYITDGIRYTYIVTQIRVNKKLIKKRGFKTEEEAARVYDELAKIHHGEFANLNFKE